MTTCLFVMEDWPVTPGGSPGLIYSHLELLAVLVEQLHLVILANPRNPLGFSAYRQGQPEIWKKVSAWCSAVHFIEIDPQGQTLPALSRLTASFTNPAMYSYSGLIRCQGAQELHDLVKRAAPDLLWAEHLLPATLLEQGERACPLVYSQHDWRWKIKALRSGSKKFDFKQKLKFWFSRRHETRLVRSVEACVSGSQTELAEMRRLGATTLGYFPTTYIPVDQAPDLPVSGPPRIVHLGGMQTTANLLGLGRFLEVSWPVLLQTIIPAPELWVVGSLAGATPALLGALKQANITCTGIVPDLRTVLRPFDIHIVPWEYDTGTRTRIPLVLNHAQVLVSTRAAAACLPELLNNQNCVLVENLPGMTEAIIALFNDLSRRERIAGQGHETFLKFFTCKAQQARFNTFIHSVIER